jgi:hypothetical protein
MRTYCVMLNVLFDSIEVFEKAIPRHGATVKADLPNFTDIIPVRQINEVIVESR